MLSFLRSLGKYLMQLSELLWLPVRALKTLASFVWCLLRPILWSLSLVISGQFSVVPLTSSVCIYQPTNLSISGGSPVSGRFILIFLLLLLAWDLMHRLLERHCVITACVISIHNCITRFARKTCFNAMLLGGLLWLALDLRYYVSSETVIDS